MRDRPSILHVDMDAFFASVEILEHPELATHPVIVGGSGTRGVVASCNYEARRFGVRSAMPSARAKRLCPQAVFVDGNYGRYESYSHKLMELLEEFTPLVEAVSIDEAFMDVSGAERIWGSPSEVAVAVRKSIRERLRLDACVGAANTKHLAKLASVHAKPRVVDGQLRIGSGVLVIPPEDSIRFLHALDVRRLWGVGPKTAERLEHNGIRSVAQLARTDRDALVAIVGVASAEHLLALANNRDERPVEVMRAAKSIGHEQTFIEDLTDMSAVADCLVRQADAVSSRLRGQQKVARTVTLKVRFGTFKTVSHATTLEAATSSTSLIARAAKQLLSEVQIVSGVRLVGISVSNLEDPPSVQAQMSLDLKVEEADADYDKVDEVVDDIRRRFGSGAVMPATLAGNKGRGVLDRGERNWGPSSQDEKDHKNR